jgi:EmrB/QacA subfamily drug resistance transporter
VIASPGVDAPEPAGHTTAWTLAITGIALFMASLDNLVVTFALPTIRTDLHASVQQLEWTVNAYTLTFAVLLLTGSALGDRFGRRRMFIIGLAIFIAASAAAALSSSIEVLIAARAVQGAGAAIVVPLTLTLLSAAFSEEKRGAAIGAWSGIGGLAIALGPLVGGAIVSGIAWQWIFWVNVPIGLVAIPLAAFKLQESRGPHSRLDLVGLGLASTGLFGIVFGVIRGSDVGWTSPQVVASLVLGSAIVIAFIAWELRTPAPMLPMQFFRSRAFSAINAVSMLMYFGMFGSIFLLSQYLQAAQGYSAVEAGIRTLPWTAMPMVFSPIAGVLTERIGGRPLAFAGTALQAISLGWLAQVMSPDVAYSQLLAPFVVGGIGMAIAFPPLSIVALAAVRREEEGQASGANNAIRELGGVFGVAVLATVFVTYGGYATPQTFTDGFGPALWTGSVVVGISAVIALLIPRHRPTEAPAFAATPRA